MLARVIAAVGVAAGVGVAAPAPALPLPLLCACGAWRLLLVCIALLFLCGRVTLALRLCVRCNAETGWARCCAVVTPRLLLILRRLGVAFAIAFSTLMPRSCSALRCVALYRLVFDVRCVAFPPRCPAFAFAPVKRLALHSISFASTFDHAGVLALCALAHFCLLMLRFFLFCSCFCLALSAALRCVALRVRMLLSCFALRLLA